MALVLRRQLHIVAISLGQIALNAARKAHHQPIKRHFFVGKSCSFSMMLVKGIGSKNHATRFVSSFSYRLLAFIAFSYSQRGEMRNSHRKKCATWQAARTNAAFHPPKYKVGFPIWRKISSLPQNQAFLPCLRIAFSSSAALSNEYRSKKCQSCICSFSAAPHGTPCPFLQGGW